MREYLVQGNPIILTVTVMLLCIILLTILCEILIIYHTKSIIKESKEEENFEIEACDLEREETEPIITCKKVAIFKRCMV